MLRTWWLKLVVATITIMATTMAAQVDVGVNGLPKQPKERLLQTSTPGSQFGLNGLAMILLRDTSGTDFDEILKEESGSEVTDFTGHLPHKAKYFRSASPDVVPSIASYITGRFPAELGLNGGKYGGSSLGGDRLTLFSILRYQGYEVGHFGEWYFTESVSNYADFYFISSDAKKVEEAAQDWLNSIPRGKKYFLSVWWPKVDVTFNLGKTYNSDNWNNGVPGVAKSSPVCSDVIRDDDDPSRYKTCSRQIHKANYLHDVSQMNKILQTLKSRAGSKDGVEENVFVAFATTNGAETPLMDAHSDAKSTNRGEKRSLYEGGIRSAFRYRFFGPSLKDVVSTNLNSKAAMNSVDLLPTFASISGLPSTWFQGDNGTVLIDGVDLWDALIDDKVAYLSRYKPQTWEWMFSVPGHCMNEAPRYAIIDDSGRFKVLYEPDSQGNMTRLEFYDLFRADFELTDWSDLKRDDENGNAIRANEIKDALLTKLRTWIDDNNLGPGRHPLEVTHEGCKSKFQNEVNGGIRGSDPKELTGVVLVLADDMGVGDMSAYYPFEKGYHDQMYGKGSVHFEPNTPELDRLAAEGAIFANYYTDGSVCSPTRASILTGRLPSHFMVRMHSTTEKDSTGNKRNGVVSYLGEGYETQNGGKAPLTVLPALFKRNGWITGLFGKWHLGQDELAIAVDNPLYGFDEYQVFAKSERFNNAKDKQFPTASKPHDEFFDNQDLLFPSKAQSLIVNRTIDFIGDRVARGEKFFVNLWLQNPHAPLNLAKDFDQAAANGYPTSNNPFPGTGRDFSLMVDEAKEPVPLQIYRALMRDHDRAIGRLVDYIDGQAGIGDNVLIIYGSDNGPEHVDRYFASVGSASPYRGGKRSLYEGGIRSPGFVRWKNTIAPNRVITTPMSTKDIYPTLVSLANLSTSTALDYSTIQGRNLSCLWLGTCTDADIAPSMLFFEYREQFRGDCLSHSARFAIRWKNYKLHAQPSPPNQKYPTDPTKMGRVELYDLSKDPFESTNVLVTRRDDPAIENVKTSMLQMLTQYIASNEYDRTLFPDYTLDENEDKTRVKFRVGLSCESETKNVNTVPKGSEGIKVSEEEYNSIVAVTSS